MSGYSKLFSSIVASTIWNENASTCKVWITMLAVKDRDGVVEGTVPGLAVLARVTVKQCEQAIETLSAPDPHSRTPAKEGRRIEAHADGWRIVNHDLYQERGSLEDKREKGRLRVERFRERRNASVTLGNDASRSPCSASASASASGKEGRKEELHGLAAAASQEVDALRRCLSDLGVLGRASTKTLAVVLARLLEVAWTPDTVREVFAGMDGKTEKQRAGQLASLLLDAARFEKFNDDLCRRASEARYRNGK